MTDLKIRLTRFSHTTVKCPYRILSLSAIAMNAPSFSVCFFSAPLCMKLRCLMPASPLHCGRDSSGGGAVRTGLRGAKTSEWSAGSAEPRIARRHGCRTARTMLFRLLPDLLCGLRRLRLLRRFLRRGGQRGWGLSCRGRVRFRKQGWQVHGLRQFSFLR